MQQRVIDKSGNFYLLDNELCLQLRQCWWDFKWIISNITVENTIEIHDGRRRTLYGHWYEHENEIKEN